MSDIDLAKYKTLYLQTAREHLTDIKKNLVLLDQNKESPQLIYEIFRLFHSLKSQNYFMGFGKTAWLCKAVEEYFKSVKDGKTNYQISFSGIILDVIAKLEKSLQSIEIANSEIDFTAEIINLEKQLRTDENTFN